MKSASTLIIEVAMEVAVVVPFTAVSLHFADVTVSEGALTGGAVGAIVLAGGAVVQWIINIRKTMTETKVTQTETEQEAFDRQTNRDREVRKDAMDEWRQTVADLREDRELREGQIKEIREMAQQEKLDHAVTKTRLGQCEEELRQCKTDRAELFRRVEALEKGHPEHDK